MNEDLNELRAKAMAFDDIYEFGTESERGRLRTSLKFMRQRLNTNPGSDENQGLVDDIEFCARVKENERLRHTNAELVEALHSVRQVTECSNTSTYLDSIQRIVDDALRKYEATQHRNDCGLEGCTGFSCPYCARCTAECPNMRCARDEADESILPIDEGCDHFPQFRITTNDNT